MNVPSVLYMLGRLWVALALILVAPAAVAFAYAGPDRWSFVGSIGSVFAVGVVLARVYRPRGEFEEFEFDVTFTDMIEAPGIYFTDDFIVKKSNVRGVEVGDLLVVALNDLRLTPRRTGW